MTWSIFKIFLWKNFKYALSQWKIIVLQLIAFITILTAYMRATYNVAELPQMVYTFKTEELLKSYFSGEQDDLLLYTPSNTFLDNLMDNVRLELYLSAERLVAFESTSEMLLALEERRNTRSLAVIFNVDSAETFNLSYNISASSGKISTSKVYLNDEEVVGIKDYDDYIDSGFFILQRMIDKSFIDLKTGKGSYVSVEVAPIPFVGMEIIDNARIITFGALFSFLLYILILNIFLVPAVEEKQDGIKEFLVLTTPYNYLNGLTFYLIRFGILLIFLLVSLLIGGLWKGVGLIPVGYVFILFLLFLCSALSFAFLISVLFPTVFYAKIGGLILLLTPIALFIFDLEILQPLSYIIAPNTFLEGMSTFQIFTNKHREFSCNSLGINITDFSFKISSIYFILIMQSIVYAALYWYLSHVFPGEGGVKKPFNFMFKTSYYKPVNAHQSCVEDLLNPDIAIKIKNLTKNVKCGFNKEKIIVDNLNMDIGCNRITVLLGHNGAGKTTTINMIVGCVEKTAGEIIVCNQSDVSIYRHLIGYCPQQNVFMQYLTCLEHLQFFARLRGLKHAAAEKQASDLLKKLKLEDKANEPGRNLSGGMKRRLSLGLAISGDTRVIILDEPSSGLDPESRRELWNILLDLRKSQAILLTTHHMEEAEILGDDVAILSTGKLLCSGSTLELKRSYGCGYILKLLVNEHFNQERIMKVINECIPSATIKSIVYPTISISLPYSYQSKYEMLLSKLELLSLSLGISSHSMTNASLEDVFLNCESYDVQDSVNEKFERIAVKYMQLKDPPVDNVYYNSYKTLTSQIFAVLYKKAIFVKREWIYTLLMCCIPLISAVVSLLLVTSESAIDTSSLELSTEQIPEAVVYVKASNNMDGLYQHFKNEINKANLKFNLLNDSVDIVEELLRLEKEDLSYFYEHVIGAVEVINNEEETLVKLLHSGNIIHSSVMMMNLADNAILKYLSNGKGEIRATNFPSKRAAVISAARLEYFNTLMPVGFLFYMIFYITLPFKEERSGFKQLQFARRLVYWLSFTLFDVFIHTIVCLFVFLLQNCIPEREIYNSREMVSVMMTFIFYGVSYLPLLYILASSFRSMSTLSAFFLLQASISSITPLITSGSTNAMAQYDGVITVMSLLPDFSLNHQLRLISENYFITRRNDAVKNHAVKTASAPHFNITGVQTETFNITVFFFYAVVIFFLSEIFLILVWDNKKRRHAMTNFLSFKCVRGNKKLIPFNTDEVDVQAEKQRVAGIISSGGDVLKQPLVVRNLHKNYDKIHAVRGLNFAVKQGECFGLLGINGAGKTSTFQMITANETISDGEVFINGVNIFKNENMYKFLFGYCPQGDALNDFMTSYELLKYMALLRGTRLCNIENEVMGWLSKLELERYKDVPIKHYSGGTKRKMNTALAMVGNPPVLFLDEPTTGVDPISRRFMWKCIQEFQKNNKTVVLTSHSMDECEHLCNRLAIMADGQFQCLGFIPALKLKFGTGFTLTIRLEKHIPKDAANNLDLKIRTLFKCEVKERHADIINYFVYSDVIVWSEVFAKTEKLFAENRNLLKDYSVNETTLEDIFLKFENKNKNIGISIV